jgi:hypothetical protein
MRRPVQSISRFETGKPMRPRAEVKTKEGFPGFKKGGMKKTLTGGQLKIAAKAPPTNKIDEKDFAVLREEKAKGRGKGLQDEKMKPGKVMKARGGEFIKRRMLAAGKSDGDTSFDAKKRAQDMGIIDKKTGAGRKRFMEKAKSVKLGKRLLIPIAIGIAGVQALKSKIKKKEEKNKKTLRDFREQKKPGIPSEKTKTINKALNKLNKKMGGGMMKKYNKGGGADTGKVGEIKSQFGVTLNRVKRYAKKIKDKDRLTARDISTLKELTPKKMFPPKKMGGGMMKRPMGYTKGGGADTGRIGELKSKIGVLSNKLKRRGPGTGIPTSADIKKIKERLSLKNLKQAGRTGAVKLVERSMKILKDNKKMGGGMMKKYNKGGGADTGKVGEIKSQFGVTLNRVKRYAKKIKDKDRLTARDISTLKELTPKKMFPPRKMGGGMMQRPMGMMKKGQMIKARGGGMARTKPTKMF